MNMAMKKHLSLAIISLLVCFTALRAQDTPPASPDLKEQLTQVMEEVSKLYEGEVTDVAAYAEHLQKLEDLYQVAKAGDAEILPSIGGSLGMIYQHILEDLPAAKQQFERIMADCAGSAAAEKAKGQIARIEIQMALVAGSEFPPFSFTNLAGKEISLVDYRGQVVLIDFWATWCPPCVADMPDVIALYQEFHDKGFEIIGISLDKDMEKLQAYLLKNGMTWPQYFDGKAWGNDLSNRYGVSSIPATFLLDRKGVIIGRNLRGERLKAAVAKALE